MKLLEKQRQLQVQSFGTDPYDLSGDDLVEFVRWNVLAATDELHEALNVLSGWKPWSDAEPAIADRDAYVEELVDVMHFVGNLLLAAGVTDRELEQAYDEKARKNAERQEEGYTG
jgi:dimeric dUTPase (all-alpha-NTP-PPase superfamily)